MGRKSNGSGPEPAKVRRISRKMRRANAKLEARRSAYDDAPQGPGRKRPGSLNK